MIAPLSGVRVVEVSSWMAAPSAGAVLTDLGAEVVKIEPIGGDPVRGMIRQPKLPPGTPTVDYSFQVDNRGKRSVAIALDRPEGAELAGRLVDDADVFLCNLLPHRQARFGLDAPTLLARNSRLVHATFSGYGLTGPDMMRPGYDVTAFFGRGAVTDSMTDRGAEAPHPRPAQGDHAAGLALVTAILAGLRLAEQTGHGQVVDVSLFATAVWTMATDLSATLVDGRQPSKRDRHHVISPLANRFRCGDDRWVVFNMPEAHWWPRFCAAVGRPEWSDDPRFDTAKNRFDHMPELIGLIDEVFATKPLREWALVFDGAGLIWAPAATLAELAADPQADAVGLFPEIEHPAVGRFRTVASPLRIEGCEVGPRGPAPDIGEHTAEVLVATGLTLGEVAALAAAGVIGPAGLADTASDDDIDDDELDEAAAGDSGTLAAPTGS